MSRGARRRQRQQPRTLQVFLIIVLILLTACVAVKAFFLKAPEQKVDELPSQPSSTGDPQLSEEEQAAQEALRSHLERKGGFYTILVSGSDDGNGNSDTNILVAVDTVNGYVYGVSIPRDSKAVWDGKSHKINAAFGKGGMTKLAEVVSDQLGIPVDYTVSVDLTGFEALVEAIGGVNFDVPINMDYDDPIQNLSIHFKKGVQYLNGADAMRVVRFRHNNDGTGYGSFPGSDAALQGQDYPFPTVLQGTDSTGEKTVNLHYGAWPKVGMLWKEGIVSLDLIADYESTSGAVKKLELNLLNVPEVTGTALPEFTYSPEGVVTATG